MGWWWWVGSMADGAIFHPVSSLAGILSRLTSRGPFGSQTPQAIIRNHDFDDNFSKAAIVYVPEW